jgi:hypothetical protein
MNPRARRNGIVVQEVAGETLVYDLDRHRAHCLAPVLAEVWRRCNGRRSPGQIARVVERRTGQPMDEQALAVALRRLARAKLLEDAPGRIAPAPGRRELLKKAAAVAGLSLVSVVAPRASEAASCVTSAGCMALGNKFCTNQPCCTPGAPAGTACTKKANGPNCSCTPP